MNHDDYIDPDFSLGVNRKISTEEFLAHLKDDMRAQRLFYKRGYISSNDFQYLTSDRIGVDVLSDEDRRKEWLRSTEKALNIDNAGIANYTVFPFTCILFDASKYSGDAMMQKLKDMVFNL